LDDSIKLIESFDRAGKPISFVCHAPAVLRNVKAENGEPLIKGRRVTGFTNGEEAGVQLTEVVPFLIEDEFISLGANYEKGPDWAPYVVEDGQLITGQNPASSEGVAKALIALLG
jgi:putative intracellular protease/amidase